MRVFRLKGNRAWLVAMLCIMTLAGCGNQVKEKKEETKADPVKQEKAYQEMQKTSVSEAADPMANKVDFAKLQKINPDIYAWIYIPGTNINYPVLQSETEDDDYYLNTTMDNRKGLPGSVYTEKYNRKDFEDPVTVIYGHTLKAGTMFSELAKYTDKVFFDQNPFIYIYRPDKTLKYQIFSAAAFDDRYLLGNYNFDNAEDFEEYIGEQNSSLDGNINAGVSVNAQNKVITLSTCIDEFPEQRWLVSAVLL